MKKLDPLITDFVDEYLKLDEKAVKNAFFRQSPQFPQPPLITKVMNIEAEGIRIKGLSTRGYGRIDFLRLCN